MFNMYINYIMFNIYITQLKVIIKIKIKKYERKSIDANIRFSKRVA